MISIWRRPWFKKKHLVSWILVSQTWRSASFALMPSSATKAQFRGSHSMLSSLMKGSNPDNAVNGGSGFILPPQPPIEYFQTGNAGLDPMDSLLETIVNLQTSERDSIRIVKDYQVPERLRHINSIVFALPSISHAAYVLAVLDSTDRVNTTMLEQAVVELYQNIDADERRSLISLASMEQLVSLCGFASRTVPPLGLTPPPLLTVVEQSLVQEGSHDDHPNEILVGGGGMPDQSILLPISTLLNSGDKALEHPVHVAHFREEPSPRTRGPRQSSSAKSATAQTSSSVILSGHEFEKYQKPYFTVAPPDKNVALSRIQQQEEEEGKSDPSLTPEWVVAVGRISGVRRMARRLVFCDLAPVVNTSSSAEDVHPWRNPRTDEVMAVQLILGKTICQRMGLDQAEIAFKQLKPGQLIMIQGKTNVGNRDSLKNWVTKNSLDIVVFDFEHLHSEAETSVWNKPIDAMSKIGAHSVLKLTDDNAFETNTLPALRLQNLYPAATLKETVTMVHDLASVNEFVLDLERWLETNPEKVGMVGIDCEWKPNFLAGSEPQPVLLLQVCLHDLKSIYLFDLQTLLRPLRDKSEDLTEVEEATANAIRILYQTPRLIKVGFQVHNDLQRLAASYPHIIEFCEIESVLEISKMGRRALHMTREASRGRMVTSSLVKMVEFFLQQALNKQEQVSDWSLRPLSQGQVEYAALDAVVTPCLADCLFSKVNASFHYESKGSNSNGTLDSTVTLGRVPNDVSYSGFMTSWRFLLVDFKDQVTIQRWNAKRTVGDAYYVVSQTWNAGSPPPQLPTQPTEKENDAFVDLNGIRKIPSHTIGIDPNKIDSILGTFVTKSKEKCVLDFVEDSQLPLFEESNLLATQLDFQARSGYVEMANAVVLFVTLPVKYGSGGSRSYPNEWLEDGSILTWFIKEYEWKNGESRLGQKMKDPSRNDVILFVRRGKGIFFCCGRCRVVTLHASPKTTKSIGTQSDQWNITKLYLLLVDYTKLNVLEDFLTLVHP